MTTRSRRTPTKNTDFTGHPGIPENPVGFLKGEQTGLWAEVTHQTFTQRTAPVLALPAATALTRGSPGWLNFS